MKPRMTDCPPAAFVEAGAELRLLSRVCDTKVTIGQCSFFVAQNLAY
jgi:hypothetical protein